MRRLIRRLRKLIISKVIEIVREEPLFRTKESLRRRRLVRDSRIELMNRDLARELVNLEHSKFGGFTLCFRVFSYFARVRRTLIVKGGMS